VFAVTGFRTSIVRELKDLTQEPVIRIEADWRTYDASFYPPRVPRYVLAAGVLHGKRMAEQTAAEINECWAVNCVNVVRICERVLGMNPHARICVIGSESGTRGSFDETYALSKAAVHQYVRWRKVKSTQQIICVAPTIIADSGMTQRRTDYPRVLRERRTVRAETVAREVHSVLWGDALISNAVIPVTSA
jgi:NADP-dependent 3-hydroxy acid dehydrogenase YdfG